MFFRVKYQTEDISKIVSISVIVLWFEVLNTKSTAHNSSFLLFIVISFRFLQMKTRRSNFADRMGSYNDLRILSRGSFVLTSSLRLTPTFKNLLSDKISYVCEIFSSANCASGLELNEGRGFVDCSAHSRFYFLSLKSIYCF